MIKRTFILLSLLCCLSASAQTPWRTIDSLVETKAYADAYTMIRQNYAYAKQDDTITSGGSPSYDLLRAAYGLASVGRKLSDTVSTEAILRHTLPYLAPTERALCHSLLASIYVHVSKYNKGPFDRNITDWLGSIEPTDTVFRSWDPARLNDSILSHSRAALSTSKALLQGKQVADYDFLTEHDSVNSYAALTLYEAVSYAALHNIVGTTLLFSDRGLVYSDSLYRTLVNPFALACMDIPQNGTTLYKLTILKEVAQYLISQNTDTSSVRWQTLCRELKGFVNHYTGGHRRGVFRSTGPSPIYYVDVAPVVSPDSGCFFTYRGDTSATLHIRIVPDISGALDTMSRLDKVRFALSQPVVHDFAMQVQRAGKGDGDRRRYYFPPVPVGKYSMLVANEPFPASADVPDSCLRSFYIHSFSCQTADIEPIDRANGQGLVLSTVTGQPIAGIPVSLTAIPRKEDDSVSDTLTLVAYTDTTGRYDFGPLMPEKGKFAASYSIDDQGQRLTDLGHNIYGSLSFHQEWEEGADTSVSFFLNAPVYRYTDTVHFTVTAYHQTPGDREAPRPIPHYRLRVDMKAGIYSDSITSLHLTTDDMGWAEGHIVLSKVLNPNEDYDNDFSLSSYSLNGDQLGGVQFEVDNYTLPTLSLTLNATSDTQRYGRPVCVEGRLTSRSGAAVAPDSVSYTLTQWFAYADWVKDVGNEHDGGRFLVGKGRLPVNPDGSFTLRFTPEKYEYLPYRDGEYAVYRVEVTATDPTGEEAEETLEIPVGDYTGWLSIVNYNHHGVDITGNWYSDYIEGLEAIYVSCKALDNKLLSVTARLVIETAEPQPTVVWQGDIAIPAKQTSLDKLVPAIALPDGHLRFSLTSDNPCLRPSTLQASYLGFDATMPLDSLTIFASTEKDQYHIGDTLRVRVGSAKKASAMLLVSHEGSIIMLRHLRLDHGFTHIAIPIEEKWEGTLGVSVLAYRNGQRFVGSASVNVYRPRPQLKWQWIEPEGFNLTPADSGFHVQRLFAGAPGHWRLRFTDTLGNPVQTTLALTAYDNALNNLSGHGYSPFISYSYHSSIPFRGNYNRLYCTFEQKYYRNNTKILNPAKSAPKTQKPFFALRKPEGNSRRQPSLGYPDLDMVNTLLSVGTHGYDVLYCAAATIGPDEDWFILNQQAMPQGVLRTDLSPYGPWFGNLRSDHDGIVDIRFNAPQRIARWYIDAVAMDRQGTTVFFCNTYDTYRDIMLMPNVPPFLYEGDSTSMAVRIDRYDGATAKGLDIRMYDGNKAQGKGVSKSLLDGATQVQFPMVAPRTLLPFMSRHRDFTLTATDPMHGDFVIDALSSSVNLLRRPRLHGNAYALSATDYSALQSRAKDLFHGKNNPIDISIQIIFDTLYCAAAYHNSRAVDSLIEVLDKLQLPSGGWPCRQRQKTIFNETCVLAYLKTLMLIEKECPHVKIPESFRIQRSLQLADSLMFIHWNKYPKSRNSAREWFTVHDHFSRYPLDSMYFPMRDSLFANMLKKPEKWDIQVFYRHGDTALARKMARNIVQSSAYDPNHPERGRHWKDIGNSATAQLDHIDIFEEVLHDTVLADQVRQRIRYLLPTNVWYGTNRARLISRGFIRDPHWYKEHVDNSIVLVREIKSLEEPASPDSPYGEYMITLTVTLDRPVNHLHIRSPHAACFSSHSTVSFIASSSAKFTDIQVKDVADSRIGTAAKQFAGKPDCLDIFIYSLPAGTHKLMYTVTTDRTGRFHLPPATVQCLALPWQESKKGLLQASTPAETLMR